MKRIYACLCIVAVLLGVAFYSSWRVQKFAEDISDDIDDAMEAIRDEDLPSARQALAEGAELCDKMREGMNHLLKSAYMHHQVHHHLYQTNNCLLLKFLSDINKFLLL